MYKEITPIMAEYVADVFSRKEHLDNISFGYCMEIADVFRRYAERVEQEQPSEDLEKAAENHIRKAIDAIPHPGWNWDAEDVEEAFKAGAQWQKEQMMKDAVDGKIVSLPARNDIEMQTDEFKKATANFKDGQKVKVIIVKEDAK